MFKQDFLRRQ